MTEQCKVCGSFGMEQYCARSRFVCPQHSNWDKPDGCHCPTTWERDRCYENCEPVKPEPKRARTPMILFFIIGLLLGMMTTRGHGAELVPDAPKQPRFCYVFMALPRTCTAARLVVKMYGAAEAERRARICGASDEDIAQAKTCLADHGEQP